MNKLILILIVSTAATAATNKKCATTAELAQEGDRFYKLKYMKTADSKKETDLTTANSMGFDKADHTCGDDCHYIETEYDTKFKITGAPAKNTFRIYSEDGKLVMSWNQRNAGRGYYMFDAHASQKDFIDGAYRHYTLMTYDEDKKQLFSAIDNNANFEALGVFPQDGNEIFRQESIGGEDTKFCFVEYDQNDEAEIANVCATKDELIHSNFENYKLKYRPYDLTEWTSIGFKRKYKFTCPVTCGEGGHTIRAGQAFDTTFKIEGVPGKDGFRIFSEDRKKIFSWNQQNTSVEPILNAAKAVLGAGKGSIVGGSIALAGMPFGPPGIAVGAVAVTVGPIVGATIGSVETIHNAVNEAPAGWGFFMYDVPRNMKEYKHVADADYQHFTLMSFNNDRELQYTSSEGERAAVGINHYRKTAIYRIGDKAEFCFMKVGNANKLLPY